jgi:lysophospholipase L1-like esterase
MVLAAEPAPDYFFQPKDRIVFLGDSITEQYQYSTYMELYLTTRFPKADYFFLNAGIGGDTAQGGANRFRSQVLAEKPNKVTINFGMNDGGYGKFNPQANKVFIERTRDMLRMAKEAGVKVALVSPNAVAIKAMGLNTLKRRNFSTRHWRVLPRSLEFRLLTSTPLPAPHRT